ncbi:MAG TPA: DedA family protein [Terriglobales bacterium]|nr:DedA family protein [Terriglobales bacterium]
MAHWVLEHLSYYFLQYGYLTVLVGLLLENAGIPLPGETILITASVLSRTTHQLNIVLVALVAIFAAITGDNLGFALGRYAGSPLLARYRKIFHIDPATIRKGEDLFRRRGAVAVFFARFIAGLRVLAGPLAGTLKMPWKHFLIFNALGAIVWVAVVATSAYFLGHAIESVLTHGSLALATIIFLISLLWWLRRRHTRRLGL